MRKWHTSKHLPLETRSRFAISFRKCLRSLDKALSRLPPASSFLPIVTRALQLKPSRIAIRGWVSRRVTERGTMFTRMTAEGRLLGFNIGDWTMLLGGLTLAALVALLV
jgi:hypothetical protein